MCLCMALSASARGRNSDSFFYTKGYAFDVEISDNFLYGGYIPAYGKVGFSYKNGNGLDAGLFLCGGMSWLGLEGGAYVQTRYHFFNANLSPFMSVGIGMNLSLETEQLMPDLRVGVGVSYRRFSLSFNYEAVWGSLYVNGNGMDNVEVNVSTFIPSVALTFSF